MSSGGANIGLVGFELALSTSYTMNSGLLHFDYTLPIGISQLSFAISLPLQLLRWTSMRIVTLLLKVIAKSVSLYALMESSLFLCGLLLKSVMGQLRVGCACHSVCTVPDTSYLRGSEVFHSYSTQVFVKVREDICSATAPLLCTTCADSAEGFTTDLCTSDCVDFRWCWEILLDFGALRDAVCWRRFLISI